MTTETEILDYYNALSSAPTIYDALNTFSREIHKRNVDAGWWTDLDTGEDLLGYKEGKPEKFSNAKRDILNLLCLVHSEVSESAEGVRKNCPDDKLPHRSMFEVELADVFIRIFDIAGAFNLDLGGAVREKLAYNANRADHKVENRINEGGKAF
jgi:NTP pyrophosphatase (non-canonical NTP hydrolase)